MFSVEQKRHIAEAVQQVLRATGHPELPSTEIQFTLQVQGSESWSWAVIKNNGSVAQLGINPGTKSRHAVPHRVKDATGPQENPCHEFQGHAVRTQPTTLRKCRIPLRDLLTAVSSVG